MPSLRTTLSTLLLTAPLCGTAIADGYPIESSQIAPVPEPYFESGPVEYEPAPPASTPVETYDSPPANRSDPRAWTTMPPPGTLGQTYARPSALIPRDEHPRTARIEIEGVRAKYVDVVGLVEFEGFRDRDGVWHFKSKRPLTPGVPHIYEVIAYDGDPGVGDDSRVVRMIPGRIVTLSY